MRNKDLRERIKYSKEYKNNIVIGIELREIIVGVILGDATVLRRYPKSDAVIKFCQCEKNKDYLYHLYEKLEPLVATPPKRVVLKREKDYVQYMFQTLSFKFINEYRDKFYDKDGRKIIPEDIGDILTARSLAFWLQDDGSKSNSGYTLHTESFRKGEVELLRKVLKNKFNIEATIHSSNRNGKTYYILYIGVRSALIFRGLVEEYMEESMRRKL